MTTLLTIFTFLVMFSILVAVHEWGHYLAARFFKMGVSEFSIGFGPKVKMWKRKLTTMPNEDLLSTDFNFRAIPLGGFVKIEGMEPQPDGSETKVPHGFYSKPPIQRIAVLFAGPLFSLLFGVLVLFFTIWGYGVSEQSNRIETVLADMPAISAGLKPDDRIMQINGKSTVAPYTAMMAIRGSKGEPLKLTIDRAGKTLEFTLTPKLSKEEVDLLDKDGLPTGTKAKVPMIGIGFAFARTPQTAVQALKTAVEVPIISVERLVYRLTQPAKLIEETTGVVGMAAVTNSAVKSGIEDVLFISGMISISLGITNLLPIGILDGGQIFLAVIELFNRGRRLSYKLQSTFLTAGIAFLAVLFILITRQDFIRFVLPR